MHKVILVTEIISYVIRALSLVITSFNSIFVGLVDIFLRIRVCILNFWNFALAIDFLALCEIFGSRLLNLVAALPA